MGTLDRIIEMQQRGTSDTEISTQLQNEGISPTEINDSLNQAKIKNAVSPPEETPQEQVGPQGMQASVMPTQSEQISPQQTISTQSTAQETPSQQEQATEIYPPQIQPPEQQAQDNYYQETPQAYSQQDYYPPEGGMDTETISEIAEQVVTEKLNEYKKKIGDIASFKNTIQDKVEDIDDRLKRIENSIDKLQQSVIGKIGEFGENYAIIHKDLDNLHGTVSKLMNPLIDNYKELKKIAK